MTAETATPRVATSDSSAPNDSSQFAQLLHQYGCGPIPFSGSDDALYERHLVFDRVIDPKQARSRERFESLARSIRDVLAQRWVLTKQIYVRRNPKRLYYLSMEFLIGRSLANNITNLLLDPYVQSAVQDRGIDWLDLIEQEPDSGLGNGGLGRLAACFLDSTCGCGTWNSRTAPAPCLAASAIQTRIRRNANNCA